MENTFELEDNQEQFEDNQRKFEGNQGQFRDNQNQSEQKEWFERAKREVTKTGAQNIIIRATQFEKWINQATRETNDRLNLPIETYPLYVSPIQSKTDCKQYLKWIDEIKQPKPKRKTITNYEEMRESVMNRYNCIKPEHFGDDLFPMLINSASTYATKLADNLLSPQLKDQKQHYQLILIKFYWSNVLKTAIKDFKQTKPTPLICPRSFKKPRILHQLYKKIFKPEQFKRLCENYNISANYDDHEINLKDASKIIQELGNEEIDNYIRRYGNFNANNNFRNEHNNNTAVTEMKDTDTTDYEIKSKLCSEQSHGDTCTSNNDEKLNDMTDIDETKINKQSTNNNSAQCCYNEYNCNFFNNTNFSPQNQYQQSRFHNNYALTRSNSCGNPHEQRFDPFILDCEKKFKEVIAMSKVINQKIDELNLMYQDFQKNNNCIFSPAPLYFSNGLRMEPDIHPNPNPNPILLSNLGHITDINIQEHNPVISRQNDNKSSIKCNVIDNTKDNPELLGDYVPMPCESNWMNNSPNFNDIFPELTDDFPIISQISAAHLQPPNDPTHNTIFSEEPKNYRSVDLSKVKIEDIIVFPSRKKQTSIQNEEENKIINNNQYEIFDMILAGISDKETETQAKPQTQKTKSNESVVDEKEKGKVKADEVILLLKNMILTD